MKSKTYGGLIKWDHQNKIVYLNRMLNPPSHNQRFLDKLKKENPDYEIIKSYGDMKPTL